MRADYGIRILIDLAKHYGKGLVQTSEISLRQGIPEPYLDQLLTHLRRAGFIISKRGPRGGHSLARPPTKINLGEVISALEGTITLRCVEDPQGCPRSVTCVQREVWRQIEEAVHKLLEATTIIELAEREAKQSEVKLFAPKEGVEGEGKPKSGGTIKEASAGNYEQG